MTWLKNHFRRAYATTLLLHTSYSPSFSFANAASVEENGDDHQMMPGDAKAHKREALRREMADHIDAGKSCPAPVVMTWKVRKNPNN